MGAFDEVGEALIEALTATGEIAEDQAIDLVSAGADWVAEQIEQIDLGGVVDLLRRDPARIIARADRLDALADAHAAEGAEKRAERKRARAERKRARAASVAERQG